MSAFGKPVLSPGDCKVALWDTLVLSSWLGMGGGSALSSSCASPPPPLVQGGVGELGDEPGRGKPVAARRESSLLSKGSSSKRCRCETSWLSSPADVPLSRRAAAMAAGESYVSHQHPLLWSEALPASSAHTAGCELRSTRTQRCENQTKPTPTLAQIPLHHNSIFSFYPTFWC